MEQMSQRIIFHVDVNSAYLSWSAVNQLKCGQNPIDIRQLGVRVTKLSNNETYQRSLFDDNKTDKQRALDKTIDNLREKYGNKAIIRSTFVNSEVSPMIEESKEEYLMMGGLYDS